MTFVRTSEKEISIWLSKLAWTAVGSQTGPGASRESPAAAELTIDERLQIYARLSIPIENSPLFRSKIGGLQFWLVNGK